MAGKKRRKAAKLHASTAEGVLSATVPTRWVKAVTGLFLLAPAWFLTQTFFLAFAKATLDHHFWTTEEFWFFGVGAVMWIFLFFAAPRPMWVYVFGHELTHALWVWAMGGKVRGMHVTKWGGHIIADRINTWIALAPYFFPIYSVLVIWLYWFTGLFTDVSGLKLFLFGAIGFTWAFHITFTCLMISKGQSDLSYGGHFFSLIVIYLVNLAILSVMLIVASPGVSAMGFARDLLHNTGSGIEFFQSILRQL